jgi:hypothetical protein
MAEQFDPAKFLPDIDFTKVTHVRLITASDLAHEQVYPDRLSVWVDGGTSETIHLTSLDILDTGLPDGDED